jgi:hypothetical protein
VGREAGHAAKGMSSDNEAEGPGNSWECGLRAMLSELRGSRISVPTIAGCGEQADLEGRQEFGQSPTFLDTIGRRTSSRQDLERIGGPTIAGCRESKQRVDRNSDRAQHSSIR